ncbi:hypothetical protein C2G38_2223848 [Gigaspora rosea]|uniref:Uncharacterized protein n=1 Tax=Gigaspora rosea TaxID=44941 RepID=A0A397U105_9GLOM|nr:hypothetical protein C2G38_2223848 [Gigaspora rosea]
MFSTESCYPSYASKRSTLKDENSVSSSTSTSSSLSRTSSQNSEDEAFKECIEAIESNLDSNIINKANDKEKKCEIANAARCWEFDDSIVIIYELPNCDHEVTHGEFTLQFMFAFANLPFQDRVSSIGATTCRDPARRSAKQPDASFVPKCLPKSSPHPSDAQDNPWPTVVCEVARSQSLRHILHKVNSFWLAPNRSEDCYKFCREASLLAGQTQGNFRPVQTLEFGTINKYDVLYNGCLAPGMRTLTITSACVYKGHNPPHPLSVNVVIDLFNIQQEIFEHQ